MATAVGAVADVSSGPSPKGLAFRGLGVRVYGSGSLWSNRMLKMEDWVRDGQYHTDESETWVSNYHSPCTQVAGSRANLFKSRTVSTPS